MKNKRKFSVAPKWVETIWLSNLAWNVKIDTSNIQRIYGKTINNNYVFYWFDSTEFIDKVNRLANIFWISWYDENWWKKKQLEVMKELNKKIPKWENVDRSQLSQNMLEIYAIKDMIILNKIISRWKPIQDKWVKDTTYEIKQWKRKRKDIYAVWHLWPDLYDFLKKKWWIT